MDITIYLPDELGERAKREDINLSRMLRDAIEVEFAMRDASSTTLGNSQVYEVDLEEEDLNYTGRITGVLIADDDRTKLQVYLTEDERILMYEPKKRQCWEVQDAEEDLRALSDGEYIQAMHALGIKPKLNL